MTKAINVRERTIERMAGGKTQVAKERKDRDLPVGIETGSSIGTKKEENGGAFYISICRSE